MSICERCGNETISTIMSKFNRDLLCRLCKKDERDAPGYKAADDAEVEAVRRQIRDHGPADFAGVGLGPDDLVFLAARIAARRGGAVEPAKIGMWVICTAAEGLEMNAWLVSCDVDARNGVGSVQCTTDPKEAMPFDGPVEALEYWKRISTVRPTRQDGEPNRPMTAYTIELRPLPRRA